MNAFTNNKWYIKNKNNEYNDKKKEQMDFQKARYDILKTLEKQYVSVRKRISKRITFTFNPITKDQVKYELALMCSYIREYSKMYHLCSDPDVYIDNMIDTLYKVQKDAVAKIHENYKDNIVFQVYMENGAFLGLFPSK